MKTKIKFILPILLIMTLAHVNPVWAIPNYAQKLQKESDRLENQATKSAANQSKELANIQNSAGNMIAARLTSLQNLITRINNDTRLSSDEKTTFINNINTTITNLQTLKTKIDADTDVTTARADRKSIVTSYRIYLIFEPQLRYTLIIDNLLTVTTNLQGQLPQIQDLLNTLKSQGKNTTTLQAALDDISAKLTAITTILNNDKTTIASLNPSSTSYITAFTSIRTDFTKVRTDFMTIRTDFQSIEKGLKVLFIATPTTTPTK